MMNFFNKKRHNVLNKNEFFNKMNEILSTHNDSTVILVSHNEENFFRVKIVIRASEQPIELIISKNIATDVLSLRAVIIHRFKDELNWAGIFTAYGTTMFNLTRYAVK